MCEGAWVGKGRLCVCVNMCTCVHTKDCIVCEFVCTFVPDTVCTVVQSQ